MLRSFPVFRGFNKDCIHVSVQRVQQGLYSCQCSEGSTRIISSMFKFSLFLYNEPKCVDLRTVIDESLSFFSIRVANSVFYILHGIN